MDRNTFTGLFLILVIFVASIFFLKPSDTEIKKEREKQRIDSIKRVNGGKVVAQDTLAKTAKPVVVDSSVFKGPFGAAMAGTEQGITLENEDIKITFANKGGKILSAEVKGQKTSKGAPLILFDGKDNRFGLLFNAGGKSINTNDLYFTTTSASANVKGTDSAAVTFRVNYSATQFIEYTYSLKGKSNKLGFNVKTTGMQDVVADNATTLTLNWEATLKQQEKDIKTEQKYSTIFYRNTDESTDHLSVAKDDKKELASTSTKLQWFSFKQHFFSSVLIAKEGFEKGTIEVRNSITPGDVKWYGANVQIPFKRNSVQSFPMEFYFGTNKFNTLKEQGGGYHLEKQVDLGWGPLKYVNRYAVIPLFDLLNSMNLGYGLIILLLTIILKLVLSPLTYKSYLSMAKMRILKPEMDEIKAKVGDDNPTLLQQEYLKLYKKVGVNPLGGCIPMILQIPIVMAFFFFFPNLFELRGESFLWMKDLSTFDEFIHWGGNIPLISSIFGNHLSLMCVLMTISTLIYTYFNNQISGATGQMKYIGYIMPIVFLGVLNSYPAGLNYYYFLANMLTFLQQYLIRRMVDDNKIHTMLQENKNKPETEKKKSGFQKRIDDYMRQQQIQQGKK